MVSWDRRRGGSGRGREEEEGTLPSHLLWPPLFDSLPGPALNGPGAGGDVCAH